MSSLPLPQTPSPNPSPARAGVLARIALPLCLFSGALALLLLLSWLFVLPHFTRFQVGGRLLGASAISAYGQELNGSIRTLETERARLVIPMHDVRYQALSTERAGRIQTDAIRSAILGVATAVADPQTIILTSVTYDLRRSAVHVEGEVRTAGPRSMTVLAQFAEALGSAPFTASLTPPVYARQEGPSGTFHSPFSLDIVLAGSRLAPPHD